MPQSTPGISGNSKWPLLRWSQTSLHLCNPCLILLFYSPSHLPMPPLKKTSWSSSPHSCPLLLPGQLQMLPMFPFPGSLVPGKAGEELAPLPGAEAALPDCSLAVPQIFLSAASTNLQSPVYKDQTDSTGLTGNRFHNTHPPSTFF